MKHRVWSNPNLEWEGFQPVAYWLDLKKTHDLPLIRVMEDGKTEEPTTVGDALAFLKDKQIKPDAFDRGVFGDEFVTTDESMTVKVKGLPFNRDILRVMLKMFADEINPYRTVWYYYDHDYCREDPHENYSFFVVTNDKIVRERIAFSDYHESGFDPTVFEMNDHKDAIWGDEADWDVADTSYWYRKFYTETRTGQLMALRPDEPKLYFYERTGPDVMAAIGVLNQSLIRMKLLLWILVIVSVVGLIIHWK